MQPQFSLNNEILEVFPGYVFWKDYNSCYLGSNNAMALLIGLNCPSEIVNKTDQDLIWSEKADFLVEFDRKVMHENIEQTTEISFRAKDSRIITYIITEKPLLDNKNNITGVLGTIMDITYQKTIELDIREKSRMSNIYLKNILANLPELIYWIDKKGAMLGCNQAEIDFYGLKKQEQLIGKTVYELGIPLGWDKKTMDALRKNDKEIMATGRPKIAEEVGKTREGDLKTYISHKAPLFDDKGQIIGIIGISVDITKRKKVEEELRIAKELAESLAMGSLEKLRLSNIYLENILVNLPEPIYWLDKNSVTLGANDAEAKLYGLESAKEMVGKSIYDFGKTLGWSEKTVDKLRRHDLHVMQTGKAIVIEETAILPPDNKERTFLSHKAPLFDDRRQIIGLIGTAVDITEQKKIEEELRLAKNAAEASDRAKSEFITNMSHDVKTPLSGIIGLSEVLAPRTKDTENLDMIKMIHNGGKQLLNFFENCLEMAKLESADLILTNENFDLHVLLEELMELFLPSVKNKGLALNVHCDERLPNRIYGGHAGIYRILLNLLGNAIKFTKEGSITVNVTLDEKPSKNKKTDVIISITDTGMGIPEDKISTIFDRFSRVVPSYRGTYEGHGIGLYIVKKFVSTMGGTIDVESEVNKGTCFTVRIPFSMTPSLKKSNSSKKLGKTKKISPITPTTKSSKGIKQSEVPTKVAQLLLVEDNFMAQKVAQSLLTHLGYQVEVAASGEQVLEKFKPGKYDLIFMDIGLPDMEGTDVTQRLRELEKGSEYHVPIIALSAHAVKTIKEKCLKVGMDDVLGKPLSAEKTEEVLKKYLKDSKKVSKKSREGKKVKGTEELAVIGDAVDKQMLDLFMQSLPESKSEIEAAYQSGNIELLIKAVHKLHGALCYTNTPQLREAIETMEISLKNGETDQADTLYKTVKKALVAFEKEYHKL